VEIFTILQAADDIIPILRENDIVTDDDESESLFLDLCIADIDDMFSDRRANIIARGALSLLRREVDLSQRVNK